MALTVVKRHIIQPHGQVTAVPTHPNWQMLSPLHKDTRSPHESSPDASWLLAQDAESSYYLRRGGCSGSGFDPQLDLITLPLKTARQTVGSKGRCSHSTFCSYHTNVRALKYYHRSRIEELQEALYQPNSLTLISGISGIIFIVLPLHLLWEHVQMDDIFKDRFHGAIWAEWRKDQLSSFPH